MKISKKYLFALLLPILLLCLLGQETYAATTYDWRPNGSTAWASAGNWQSTTAGGVVAYPAAAYPGQSGTTDIVRIGVNTTIAAFTRQPAITTGVSYTIASLTFGNNNAPYSNTVAAVLALTIGSGSTLTVTGTVLQMHSSTGGLTNSGGRSEATGSFTYAIFTTINGPGTLHCSNFTVGDTTIPGDPYVNNFTSLTIQGSLILTVDNTFNINSASYHGDDDQTVISRNNDATVSFQSGVLTINGQLSETNTNPWDYVIDAYIPYTGFSMDLTTSANATLNLGGPNSINISIGTYYCTNAVDFYNPDGGTGQSTVNYSSTGNQEVYDYASFPLYAIDPDPYMYQNLSFGGSGTKTFDADTTTVGGNVTLNAGSEIVDLSANTGSLTLPGTLTLGTGSTLKLGSGAIAVTGAVTNAGTITLGSGNFSMANNFTNSGTINSGSSTVIFNGTGAVNLNDSATGGTIFNNVDFTSGYNATIQSGTFGVSSTGVMTLSNSGTQVVAGGFNFIFKSDASGAATLAALPSGCQLTGTNITVQRYIPGGSAAERGYRLLSPSTYTTTDTHGNHIYSISYLLNSTYISGTAFPSTASNPNSKTGNPSLYLYRENVVPQFTTFLNSNYRGIESIASDPYYLINTDSDGSGTQYDIPVGNGYLFFFRGGETTTNPFSTSSIPANGTLASTGNLNEGNITVTNWYNESLGNTGLLYTTASGSTGIEGTNLVGNPYPATIDWNNFSSTNSSAAIYGPGLSGAIWMLVPGAEAGSGNYATYLPGVGATNGGTNLIASGEGFFVQATGTGATLKFTENAKVSTQATGAAVFMANKQSLSVISGVKEQIRLQMQLDSINADEMLISFNPNTSAGFNIMEDVQYKTGTGKVNLASLSSDNVALAINQLPLALKGDTIKLKVGASASGTYTLKAESITGIPQIYDVWLKDAFTKDSVNLRTTSTYSFTVNTGDTTTFGSHRFVLTLQEDPALAYKLISFDAEKTGDGRQVQTTWTTQNEANYTSFTVERSNDGGKTYNAVGSLTSSGLGSYGFTDLHALMGDNLYRLQSADFNNTITYSNPVDIVFTGDGKSGNVTIFPNPVVNTINLTIAPKTQQANTSYNIRISNSMGLVVKNLVTTDTSWQNNAGSLLPGIYLVQVTDTKNNEFIGQTKFVKL